MSSSANRDHDQAVNQDPYWSQASPSPSTQSFMSSPNEVLRDQQHPDVTDAAIPTDSSQLSDPSTRSQLVDSPLQSGSNYCSSGLGQGTTSELASSTLPVSSSSGSGVANDAPRDFGNDVGVESPHPTFNNEGFGQQFALSPRLISGFQGSDDSLCSEYPGPSPHLGYSYESVPNVLLDANSGPPFDNGAANHQDSDAFPCIYTGPQGHLSFTQQQPLELNSNSIPVFQGSDDSPYSADSGLGGVSDASLDFVYNFLFDANSDGTFDSGAGNSHTNNASSYTHTEPQGHSDVPRSEVPGLPPDQMPEPTSSTTSDYHDPGTRVAPGNSPAEQAYTLLPTANKKLMDSLAARWPGAPPFVYPPHFNRPGGGRRRDLVRGNPPPPFVRAIEFYQCGEGKNTHYTKKKKYLEHLKECHAALGPFFCQCGVETPDRQKHIEHVEGCTWAMRKPGRPSKEALNRQDLDYQQLVDRLDS
ncbi:hypothetical protein F4780DRAFT_135101 [Xylariomycetidae sp. FL0641]|nr:hypothetical protein F4780DRAFT_135101 [Xylariomycetidae sp. FL0641]